MTFKISLTPWHVDMDYVLDANGERVLRVMPQDNRNTHGELVQDDERARYHLQLAACAPELLAACQAVEQAQRDGNYAQAFATVKAIVTKATTVDFQDGNIMYRQLAHDMADRK